MIVIVNWKLDKLIKDNCMARIRMYVLGKERLEIGSKEVVFCDHWISRDKGESMVLVSKFNFRGKYEQ